jgi:hypothetical protein
MGGENCYPGPGAAHQAHLPILFILSVVAHQLASARKKLRQRKIVENSSTPFWTDCFNEVL